MGKEIIVLMAVGHGFRVSDRTHIIMGQKMFWWWSVTFFGCRTGHTHGDKIVLVVVGHGFRVLDRTHMGIKLSWWWSVKVFGC